MDTRAKQQSETDAPPEQIKQHRPMTYAAINAKATTIGPAAFRFVRQGVADQPHHPRRGSFDNKPQYGTLRPRDFASESMGKKFTLGVIACPKFT